jgi:hypothetical protein
MNAHQSASEHASPARQGAATQFDLELGAVDRTGFAAELDPPGLGKHDPGLVAPASR